MTSPAQTSPCQQCGRPQASGQPYGSTCRHRIQATMTAAAAMFPPGQLAKAAEAIADGALVASSRPGVYVAASSDGTTFYTVDTATRTCTCTAGQYGQPCYHLAAALILAAARPAA